MIRLKRAYVPVEKGDGVRILVDRLWPRGIKKEKLQATFWMKDAAPSDELRKWFHSGDTANWKEFRARYLKELKRPEAQKALHDIAQAAKKGTVTLVYGAKDEKHNQAAVLKEVIESM
ncbi:MAG TPA: DUF488 family protein [Candidatus Binataceae bacterium]|nr:DUF488 family protein [Candidatus Binataceae bacterium]